MVSRGRNHWTPTSALLALVAAVSLAPSPARAGCSHPAVARTDPLAAVGRLELLEGTALPGTAVAPASPSQRQGTCQGPFCSRRDSSPLPVPAAAGFDRSEQWGLLAGAAARNGSGSRTLLPRDVPVHPLHRTLPIDRPPRSESGVPAGAPR
jgi:hypothetical protein